MDLHINKARETQTGSNGIKVSYISEKDLKVLLTYKIDLEAIIVLSALYSKYPELLALFISLYVSGSAPFEVKKSLRMVW